MRWLALLFCLFATPAMGQLSMPFPGPGVVAGISADIVTTDIGTTSDTSGCTTCTLTAQNVGTAGTISIVGIAYKMNAGGTAVSSVSVCGSPATIAVQAHASDETVAIAAIASAGSASCTVVVTFAGATVRGAVHYWRVANQASVTPIDHGSDSVASGTTCNTTGIDVSAGGAIFAVLSAQSGGDAAWSATAGTMGTDVANAGVGTQTQSFGHGDNASAQTNITVTATGSGWGDRTECTVATFR